MRSILSIIFIILFAVITGCSCEKQHSNSTARPSDSEIRQFAASHGVLVTTKSSVACTHVSIDEDRLETTLTRDTGEQSIGSYISRLSRRYEYLCIVEQTVVAKLRSNGKLVIADPATNTDE